MADAPYDLLIRNGTIVDGTGMPSYRGDIAVRDGRIERMGLVDAPAARVIDATDRIVSPGFIDVHTHYDVQLDWDPLASPAAQHGVTTVFTGNCGFSLYPSKPEDVDWLIGMLTRVEGMSREALAEGFQWDGGDFKKYWARLRGKLGVNVGAFVGHCAVRRMVMGDDASEREATQDEISGMKALVREAMEQGAIGFSTSQLDLHVGEDGRGVPSNHASAEEVIALCSVLADFPHGAIEIIARSHSQGYDEADRAMLLEMARVSGKPIELGPIGPVGEHATGWTDTVEFANSAQKQGLRLHPQAATQRIELHMRLNDTFFFDEMPTWRESLMLPLAEACEKLRDSDVRERMRHELATVERAAQIPIEDLEVEHVDQEENKSLLGHTVAELMADGHSGDVVDVFLDVSLREDLNVSWKLRFTEEAKQAAKSVVADIIREPLTVSGSSDGGAHLASFVGADFTTTLLTDYVPDELSIEQAIHRLSGMPANVHGLIDRGTLRVGAKADITIFDLDRLEAGNHEVRADFPAGTERWFVDAKGYDAVIVNGVVVMDGGKHTGATPGEVLHGA